MPQAEKSQDANAYPDYRVRLFLSIDLAGSTAYKSSKAPKEWLQVFLEFYENFPLRLKYHYEEISKSLDSDAAVLSNLQKTEGYPRVWKTVGDEILFCCRVHSLCRLCICLEAFIRSLQEYGEKIQEKGLDAKGNAWVCSFPYPTIAFKVGSAATDSLNPTETTEAEIDKNPQLYDFLGKGIDSGFRIAKNASADELTLSPALALLLYKSEFYQRRSDKHMTRHSRPIRLKEMQEFKGVAKNALYPVLVMSTCRDDDKHYLKELELQLLAQPEYADNEKLIIYLERYLKHHDIEIPIVKQSDSSPEVELPHYYLKEKEEWEREQADKKGAEEAAATEAGESTNSKDNEQDKINEIGETIKKIREFFLRD